MISNLAALAVVWCLVVPATGATRRPQADKKSPPKTAPEGGAGGVGVRRNNGLVRGREHEKAAEAAFELGVKYGRAGRYREAVEAFREAVLYQPDHGDAHFSLGHALYDLGRWAEAAESFKRAVALDPKDTEAFNYLGAAYFRQGLYDRAIEAYKGAILVKPNLADVRYNIANAFYKLGRYEPALLYYKEVSYIGSRSAQLFNDMGVAYAEWGRYAEATDAFKRATGQDSDDAYAHNNLALSYFFQGQHEEAAKAFERATRLAPRDENIRRNADLAASDSGGGGAAVGARVSLHVKTGAGGGKRDVRWLGRSDVIHGVAASDAPARAGDDTEAAAAAAPPVTSAPTPTPAQVALKSSAAAPRAAPPPSPTPTPTPAASGPARVESSGPDTPVGEVAAAAPARSEPAPVGEPAAAAATAAPPAAAPALTDVYRVGVGDVLDIRLLDDSPSRSTLYTVLAGGLVEYTPSGNSFAAAGKTTDEIAAHVKSELRRLAIRDDPRVVVSVREYASHTVIVSGLVGEPGAKVLRREAVPLYVVVADAQPLPEAGRALVTTDAGKGSIEVALDDQASMSTLVRPGDVISVLGRRQQFYYI
ncbi:MAG TPA: tetratricopeptide repeat protein, partial [Pyrinomonadaceae bacterium]|nr:tetratricopeptide repeat protein [Pyrinomonadaceae bacterium]